MHVRVQPGPRNFPCSLQVLRGLHIGATPSAHLQVQGVGSVLEGAGAQRGDCTGCPAPQFSIGLSAGPRVPELVQGFGSHSKIPSPSTVPDTANPAGVTAPDLGTPEKPSRPTGLGRNVQKLTHSRTQSLFAPGSFVCSARGQEVGMCDACGVGRGTELRSWQPSQSGIAWQPSPALLGAAASGPHIGRVLKGRS